MKKDKVISNRIKNVLISLIANGVIMTAVLIKTNMTYESGDDFAIAKYIADGNPYSGFVSYYLSRMLIAIQAQVEQLNVYVIFLIGISFISFVYISTLALNRNRSIPVAMMLAAVIIVFSFDHYCAVQFTKTAGLVTTAGFIGLVDSATLRKGPIWYALPLLLVYTGAAIRYGTFPAMFGMAAVATVVWMLVDCNEGKKEGWIKPKNMASAAVILMLIFGVFGTIKLSQMQNTSTPELKLYDEYNLVRSNVIDYPTFIYYEEKKDKYDAIGISRNDMLMIDNWRLDYEGAASLENLKKIDAIERPQKPLPDRIRGSVKRTIRYIRIGMGNSNTTGIHIIMLSFMALVMILTLRPKRWLYVFAIGGVAFSLYVYLYFVQRAIYRVLYLADIGAALWLLYYFAYCAGRKPEEFKKKTAVVCCGVLLVASLYYTPILAKNCHSKYDRLKGKVMSEAMVHYYEENRDKALIWGTGQRKRPTRYIKPWLVPDDTDKNGFGTGGWDVMSPYSLDCLAEYGMYNPIKDLINNDNAYYIGNELVPELEQYYNDWYAGDKETIKMVKIDTIDNLSVWKVVKMTNHPE